MDKKPKKKRLQFTLTIKEYSEFWDIGSLLNLTNKHEIFRQMLRLAKKFYEVNNNEK